MRSTRISLRSTLFWGLLLGGLLMAATVYAQSKPRPSPSDCDAYARNFAERYSGGILGGAAKGAVGGAIFGAIIGDKSKTTKRGAALGGIVGGSKRAIDRSRVRQQAYDDCMAGRVQW